MKKTLEPDALPQLGRLRRRRSAPRARARESGGSRVGEALFATMRRAAREARQLREADLNSRMRSAASEIVLDDDDEARGYLAACDAFRRGIPSPAQIAVKIQLAVMLDAAPGLSRQICGGTPVVIVEVPEKAVFDIVREVWRDVLLPAGWSHILASDLKRAQILPSVAFLFDQKLGRRKIDVAEVAQSVLHAVQSTAPIFALTLQGSRSLPDALLQIATHTLILPRLDSRVIDWTVRIVTGARASVSMTGDEAGRLTIDDLSLHVRHDMRPDDCLDRLRRAAERRREVRGSRDLTLDELHGMDSVVAWARSTLADLRAYAQGTLSWQEVDHAMVMEGPPGTGKNLFAKVFAEEARLPLIQASLATWQGAGDGHLGHLLRAMRQDFEKARASGGCVMFFDEIDAFANRDEIRHAHKDYVVEVINGFLEQLDGFGDREGVIFLAASNRVSRCDPAILRAGRFNRILRIGLPTPDELACMFRVRLRGALDSENLGPITEIATHFTGADVERAVRDARRRARQDAREMTLHDLEIAILGDVEDLGARERWCACVHEAGHAVMMTLLHGPHGVRAVVGRTRSAPGHTRRETGPVLFAADFEKRILETLAGRAAEALILGAPTAGAGGSAQSDLATATRIAAAMSASFGLAGPHPLVHIAPPEETPALLQDAYIRASIQDDLGGLYNAAFEILRTRAHCLMLTAVVLRETGSVSGDDVAEIARRAGDGEIQPGGVGHWSALLEKSSAPFALGGEDEPE